MPKDATKNIDRYKIRGGHLNEFEYAENQKALAGKKAKGAGKLIPGTPPEEAGEGLQPAVKAKASKATKGTKSTKGNSTKGGATKEASSSSKKGGGAKKPTGQKAASKKQTVKKQTAKKRAAAKKK